MKLTNRRIAGAFAGIALAMSAVAVGGSPSRALAPYFAGPPGWTVIDNGAPGHPGNNKYAFRCVGGSRFQAHLYSDAAGFDGAGDCGTAGGVTADATRYYAEITLVVNGNVCGTATASSANGDVGAEADLNGICGATRANSSETRKFGFFKNGFCATGECVFGYLMTTRNDQTV